MESGERSEVALRVYPNPGGGQLNVVWGGMEVVEADVYDLWGRVVARLGLRPGINAVSASDWAVGMYWIRVASIGEVMRWVKA